MEGHCLKSFYTRADSSTVKHKLILLMPDFITVINTWCDRVGRNKHTHTNAALFLLEHVKNALSPLKPIHTLFNELTTVFLGWICSGCSSCATPGQWSPNHVNQIIMSNWQHNILRFS